MSITNMDWETLEWLNDARGLIQWAREQGNSHPMLLVIRHSHREDSTDVEELQEKHLTNLGHQMALCFGKNLPSNRNLEVFFSGLPRCHETAQEIREGYIEAGGHAGLVSNIPVIMEPQESENRIGHEMMRLGSVEFVELWTKGNISTEIIVPIEEFESAFVEETLGRLQEASENSLIIHVTHDLMIMGIRSVLFGTTPNHETWTPYLGGFGVVLINESIHAFERGRELMLDNTFLASSTPFEEPG